MKKGMFVFLLLVFSAHGFGQAQSQWSGIWQNRDDPSQYVTVHERGDEVVVIVLPLVAHFNGHAFAGTYYGKKGTSALDRVSSSRDYYRQLYFHLESPTEAILNFGGDTVIGPHFWLKRVF